MFKDEHLVDEASTHAYARDAMTATGSANWEDVPLFDDPLY